MKLKKQFLSLFALLGLSMAATSAWATTVTLSGNAQEGYYVNIPETGTDELLIPNNVSEFKVYDYAGIDDDATEEVEGLVYSTSSEKNGFLLLTAPENSILRVSGRMIRGEKSGNTSAAQPYIVVYDGANNSADALIPLTYIDGSGVLNLPTKNSTGRDLYIRFRIRASSGSLGSEGLDLKIQVLKKNSTAAIDIYKQDNNGYGIAQINGDYNGSDEVSISTAIKVDSIVYNRTFTAGTPSTIVLPFSLPNTATTNAKFYYLKQVVKVDNECKWKATFRNITLDNANALPAANTPYAVIVPNATKLQFYLNGGQATFLTDDIAEQYDNTKKWIFKGTYQYKTWESNDPELGLAYALAAADDLDGAYTAGQYVKVGAGSYAIPMRAYIRKVDAYVTLQSVANGRPLAQSEISSIESLPESIDVEFIDEEEKTTAIGRMNTVTGAIKIDRWFDLKGRSTNHKPTTKGAFFNKKGIAK